VAGHPEARRSLDVRVRLVDEAAGNRGYRAALRAVDVLVVVSNGLEARLAISQLHLG